MPTRRKAPLGQNFLVDAGAARAIVAALGDIRERTVIEIGPGRGAITRQLARSAKRTMLIELDPELAAALRDEFAGSASVTIAEADVLHVDLTALAAQGGSEDGRVRVVGNLPYYITSDILLHLLRHAAVIDEAVVMMQREVAERVAAPAGTSDYGLLSATVQLGAEVERLFDLPPEAFIPRPQVHSTVLRLRFRERWSELGLLAGERDKFFVLLRAGFAQKRKTLANNLRAAGFTTAAITSALDEIGARGDVRAEALTLAQSAALFRRLVRSD